MSDRIIGVLLSGSAVSFGYLLCAVVYPIAALAVWRSRLVPTQRAVLAGCCLAISAWALAVSATIYEIVPPMVPLGLELLRSLLWLTFFLISLRGNTRLWHYIHTRISVGGLVAAGIILTLLTGFTLLWLFGKDIETRIAFWQITVSILTLLMLENLLRNCDEASHWGVRLICLGAGLMVVYDLFFYVSALASPIIDSRFSLARGFFAAAGAPIILFAMTHAASWRGNIVLSRHVVFHSAALAGAGFYLVSTSLAGEYLRTHNSIWGTTFEMAFLVSAVVVLMVVLQSASVRAKLMVFISKHFFRLKYDYRTVWLNFIRQMGNTEIQQNLHERALRSVADAIGCPSGALWALQHSIQAYVPMANWNSPLIDHTMAHVEEDLPKFLAQTGWVIDIVQCVEDPGFYGGLTLPRWLTEKERMWVIIPLIHNQLLEGFLVLGDPSTGPFELGWEDFDLLKTVGAQVASYLAEERASRELVDARRLAEVNRRFAFILHDIKNVVSQMGMMLQNAERFGDNPEFQKDMLLTVSSAVDRLREMLVQLGSEKAPPRLPLRDVDLVPTIGDIVRRWQKSMPSLEFHPCAEQVVVIAAEERLVTILDHLIQNALEAVEFKGHVSVAMAASATDGIIEIIDDGPGMTQEFIRDRLFRPLETSKSSGSGIGAYQALKTIRDMGGQLDVDSVRGRGTTMRIRLRRVAAASTTKRNELAHASSLHG